MTVVNFGKDPIKPASGAFNQIFGTSGPAVYQQFMNVSKHKKNRIGLIGDPSRWYYNTGFFVRGLGVVIVYWDEHGYIHKVKLPTDFYESDFFNQKKTPTKTVRREPDKVHSDPIYVSRKQRPPSREEVYRDQQRKDEPDELEVMFAEVFGDQPKMKLSD